MRELTCIRSALFSVASDTCKCDWGLDAPVSAPYRKRREADICLIELPLDAGADARFVESNLVHKRGHHSHANAEEMKRPLGTTGWGALSTICEISFGLASRGHWHRLPMRNPDCL
ncbi:hypothetical protein JTE90_028322 [Oedothorax gibbosus]|uniref:Uncharacterized protein n=1 Tax=Oedothorax gibbosus TaxID=931172 RepID=A0AAV6V293_9ARAC|nr:hypothetical protein JTE90_028322 [Oedothorax gibbosus]